MANLSLPEQKLLVEAKRKIKAIQNNLTNATGLALAEADVAAKTGLIDPGQRWWWTEEWQKGEREAQKDIEAGRVSKVYKNITEALADLKKQVRNFTGS